MYAYFFSTLFESDLQHAALEHKKIIPSCHRLFFGCYTVSPWYGFRPVIKLIGPPTQPSARPRPRTNSCQHGACVTKLYTVKQPFIRSTRCSCDGCYTFGCFSVFKSLIGLYCLFFHTSYQSPWSYVFFVFRLLLWVINDSIFKKCSNG